MKKIAAAFLAIAALFGTTRCVDVGIGLGRDALYLPDSDSTVVPVSALLSADFNVSPWMTLGVKGGYSWYRSGKDIFGSAADERWRIDAARIELVPTVHSPLFFDWLTLRVGIGVAGIFSYDEHYLLSHDTASIFYGESKWTRYLGGLTQSFVAGVRFRVSPRIDLGLDAECPGFVLAHEYRHGYLPLWWDGHWIQFLYDESFSSGWTSRPVAGFGASFHFKL